MINTDSYYEIGSGHVFCQDYAFNGTVVNDEKDNLFHYAIVSDGCSGSKDSDIGSRWIARNFPHAFLKAYKMDGDLRENVEKVLIASMKKGIEAMNVSIDAFDATIVALIYDQKFDRLHTFIWGDGKAFYKFKSEHGNTRILTDVGYVSNAPYYLSYKYNLNRDASYEMKFGQNYAGVFSYTFVDNNFTRIQEKDKFTQKFHYECLDRAAEILEFASVFSDGIDTYHKIDDVNIIMPKETILNQLTSYKNIYGEFLKRRMQMAKRFCQKNNWQHFDDISAATIIF